MSDTDFEKAAKKTRYTIDIARKNPRQIIDTHALEDGINAMTDAHADVVAKLSALAKLLRQYADSPNAIRLIADNIDGKR